MARYTPPPGISRLSAYRKRPGFDLQIGKVHLGTYGVFHLPIVVLYLIALLFCYQTAGNPYNDALNLQEKKTTKEHEDSWENFDKEDVDEPVIIEGKDGEETVSKDLDGDGLDDLPSSVSDCAEFGLVSFHCVRLNPD